MRSSQIAEVSLAANMQVLNNWGVGPQDEKLDAEIRRGARVSHYSLLPASLSLSFSHPATPRPLSFHLSLRPSSSLYLCLSLADPPLFPVLACPSRCSGF